MSDTGLTLRKFVDFIPQLQGNGLLFNPGLAGAADHLHDIRNKLKLQLELADKASQLKIPKTAKAKANALEAIPPGDARTYKDFMRTEASRLAELEPEIQELKIKGKQQSHIAEKTRTTWNSWVNQLSKLVKQNQATLTELAP